MHTCEPVNLMVPPLSSCKIFAQTCLKGFDLLYSISKLTRQGVQVQHFTREEILYGYSGKCKTHMGE